MSKQSELNSIWNMILNTLRDKMGEVIANTWFSQVEPVDLDGNKFVIYTPNQLHLNQIRTRFTGDLEELLELAFYGPMELLVLGNDEIDDYRAFMANNDSFPEAAGYTFDNFIVGNSNKFAHAAAVAVAKNPGTAYNPLFIYGNSGLGKTHLLLAIGNAIHSQNPSLPIAYVKGEEFTNQMVQSIKNATQEEFRQKFRNVGLLLMDDIQFIAGKIGVQEEFFHTFNTLYESGKQIVITSDRPPMEMAKLEDRLRTRFEGGLMADIAPPDVETRMAITRNKAAQLGLLLPDDVVEYIAENITANVRQLEGVVKRLTAYREILDDVITVTSVKRAIKDVIRTGAYIPTPEVIIFETGRYYGFSPEDIKGQRRQKNLAMARQVSMYLMRNLTNLSLQDIGSEFEDRNHSTVLSSIRKVEDLVKSDPEVAATIRDITSNINSRN